MALLILTLLACVPFRIINVDQDVEEDWALEVYDHEGTAHNLTMAPGDMIMYESHSVIHGRPFSFRGNFYANVFVHFEPIGPSGGLDANVLDADLPPYLMSGSSWEPEWRLLNPNGWQLFRDVLKLVERGDLPTIRHLHELDASKLTEADQFGWQPLHEAVRHGHLDIIEYLLEHGADINALSFKQARADGPHGSRTVQTRIRSPLDVAHQHLGESHPISLYLADAGGVIAPEVDQGVMHEL